MNHPVKTTLLCVCAAALCLLASAQPVKVIFDTDMLTDFDDVGALACLHALADAGECEILATVSCTRGNASVGAIQVINTYYGRGDLPVGCTKGMGVWGCNATRKPRPECKADELKLFPKLVPTPTPGSDGGHAKYLRLLKDYPGWYTYADSDDAPDANDVYRRILSEQPDGSVVICSVGFLTNLRRLLETKGDRYSPLDGKALVAKKVKRWVAMALKYPKGKEYNSMMDPESSRIVLENWPTEIVISDWEFGFDIFAGRRIAETEGPRNPVKDVFAGNIPSREEIRRDSAKWLRSCFGMGGRSAWDETAVLIAVRGAERYCHVERGTYRMIGDDGENEWAPGEDGRHLRVQARISKAQFGELIDELICRVPQSAAACAGASETDAFRIRDPFVLADVKTQTYYLYGAGNYLGETNVPASVWVRTSADLKTWSEPRTVMTAPRGIQCVWAPEVHEYKGAYYMFATLKEYPDPQRPLVMMGPTPDWSSNMSGLWRSWHATWIYRAERPEGPFVPVSDRPVTPPGWIALDGTLAVEDGKPYLVFTHDWAQVADGTVELAPLKDDLTALAGPPKTIFRASTIAPGTLRGVTDGPFVYRSPKSGKLFITWSTHNPAKLKLKQGGYCVVASESASGRLEGPWVNHRIIFDENGGHGMAFRTFDGELKFALHDPEIWGKERIALFDIVETNDREGDRPPVGKRETRLFLRLSAK